MKPAYQTIISRTRGDCLRACVASILELHISKVPNFKDFKNTRELLQKWLKKRNLYFIELTPSPENIKFFPAYHLIIYRSDKIRHMRHAVVGYQGKVVHNPQIKGKVPKVMKEMTYGIFVVIDPTIM